jgi:uncharacterized SAM-binding protein YcdF (DUF218 family)
MVMLVMGSFLTGFAIFVKNLVRNESDKGEVADGIVVLTGGSSRISDAMQLLAHGRGQRLLVTGLNPLTSRHDLARVMGKKSYLVECCVDLDYQAVNTAGNAEKTREWALKNNFIKLLIVTSNYHMPRTLLELKRVFPKGIFIPYAVESPSIEIENWGRHISNFRLLLGEYIKYLYALMRATLSNGAAL